MTLRVPVPWLVCLCGAGVVAGCSPAEDPTATRTSLVIAYPRAVADLVSHRTDDEVSSTVLRHAYEPLVDLSADLSIVPCLAETWYNPNELTWVFQLREDVVRHDGRTLTAEDVAGYFTDAAGDPAALRGAADVTAVEAAPGNRIVFRTRRPIGWLPSLIARQFVALEPAAPGEPPVGTGPYRIREWAPGGDTVLEAFDAHRDGRPAIRRVEFRVMDLKEAARALRVGSVHLMLDVPPEAWEELREAPHVRTHAQPGLRVFYLMFNLLGSAREGPLGDRRVREAVARGIDRQALLAGPGAVPGAPIRTLVPPSVFGHNPDALAPAHDPERARRLLREAGFASGLRLSLAVGLRPANEDLARRLRTALAEVGVELDLVPGFPDVARRTQHVGAPDLYLLGWLHSSGDVGASYVYLAHTPGAGAAGAVSGYSNADVDRLIAEAARPLPDRERQVDLLAIAALLQSEVAMVPLYRQIDRYAWVRSLKVSPRLDRRIRAQDLAWGEPHPASPREATGSGAPGRAGE